MKRRGQESFYTATLRQMVEQADKAKRRFGNKDEWKVVLRELHTAGHLIYDEAGSSCSLPVE